MDFGSTLNSPQDCGRDAHSHYYETHGRGEGAGVHDRARFERIHQERRTVLVANAIRALAPETSADILGVVELQHALVAELAKADLPGLGIKPDDVLARAQVPPLRVAQGLKTGAAKLSSRFTMPSSDYAAVSAADFPVATPATFAAPLAQHEVAIYEAKAAGNVRYARLYHASVVAETRMVAAWDADEFDDYIKMEAALSEVSYRPIR